jgi:hypothetical protein
MQQLPDQPAVPVVNSGYLAVDFFLHSERVRPGSHELPKVDRKGAYQKYPCDWPRGNANFGLNHPATRRHVTHKARGEPLDEFALGHRLLALTSRKRRRSKNDPAISERIDSQLLSDARANMRVAHHDQGHHRNLHG